MENAVPTSTVPDGTDRPFKARTRRKGRRQGRLHRRTFNCKGKRFLVLTLVPVPDLRRCAHGPGGMIRPGIVLGKVGPGSECSGDVL